MARLKFLLFALPVIGLWTAHLSLISPLVTERSLTEAAARARSAPEALAQTVLERRVELQRLAMKAPSTAQAAVFARALGVVPAGDKVASLCATLKDAAPEPLRRVLVVAVLNEAGGSWVKGDGEPSTDTSAFDMKSAAEAGPDGAALDAFGVAHLFYSMPLVLPDKSVEPKPVARLIVGAPLIEPTLAESLAKETGLAAIALLQGGKVLQSGGAEKAGMEKTAKELSPGISGVHGRGGSLGMGPLQLPILTQHDPMGGQAPLAYATREAIPTTPYEVIAVASVGPAMEALAKYQRVALAALMALVLLSVVWTVLMGSAQGYERDAEPIPETRQSVIPGPPEILSRSAQLPIQEAPPPPEASPDDFPFGNGPSEPPPSAAPDAFDPPPPAPAPSTPFDDLDNQPTRAFTVPSELKQQASISSPPPSMGDFNPDATRVAAIPDELLRASARTNSGENPVVSPLISRPPAAPPPRVSGVIPSAGGEEQHFHEVFKEFLATRERCGEPADGLTYEKFALKLRKNKDQLVTKYNCKTVRFQVYVKEGKAALKATPVKE